MSQHLMNDNLAHKKSTIQTHFAQNRKLRNDSHPLSCFKLFYMHKIYSCIIIFLACTSSGFSQSNIQFALDVAEKNHPNIPKSLLPAMAYAASRFENIEPVASMHHHAGPDKYGVFAVVENGEHYWNDNLRNICAYSNITIAKFKKDIQAQVNAVADYLDYLCITNNVNSLADAGQVVRAFVEIPANNLINKYARELAVYEVFYQLTHGFEKNGIVNEAVDVRIQDWFDETYIPFLTSPTVWITPNQITNGATSLSDSKLNTRNLSPLSTDYAPALWTTSPNYSSRSGTSVSAITIHTTQGSYAGTISWFQNTASQVSAHYVIRSSDGQITQMVRESNKAWHVGSENPYTIGIEHEGYVSQTSWYTTAMYNASSALVKDICKDNNIDPKTCYKGASSSGANVLSSSIKIKGHQHYPNQTHTDPGINWNWYTYYDLINPSTNNCTASNTLNESFISTSFANLNWNAVSSASGYTLQWRKTGNSSWNTINLTNNYYTISGLLAQTGYQWQVRSKCGSIYSAYSSIKSFTTKASCWDGNEPNNIYTSPSVYSFTNTFTYGKICASGDVDFFKINTTSSRNINIKLENLPKNYNLETYTGSGTYLTGSYGTGTKNESVTLYNKPAGSYLFRVYGATSTEYHNTTDYRLQVTLSSPTVAMGSSAHTIQIKSFPNPFTNELIVHTDAAILGTLLTITDYMGKVVYTSLFKNNMDEKINSSKWLSGMYIVSLHSKDGNIISRQLIYKK